MADLLPVHGLYEGTTVKAYFRTSDVYGETGGVGGKVGIKKIKDADLTGKETIVPVKELLRTADLMRIGVRYKTSAGKRKSAKLLASRAAVGRLFADGGTASDKLEGTSYKVGSADKGSIVQIGYLRRATTY
jgi:hypothetical protein